MHESPLSASLLARPLRHEARSPVRRLASLRLTLALLALLAAGTFLAYHTEAGHTWYLVPPLLLLAVNLLAAVATNPVFRRQTALLSFHLCLVVIVGLVAVGRLTELRGRVELAEGAEFDGTLTYTDAGPLHRGRLAAVRFRNEGFSIDYAAGRQRGPTHNRVTWIAPDGQQREASIGDQTPLILDGYRFYTSHNKGFAPAFTWQAADAPPLAGVVHLPAYPAHEYRQAREWRPPGAREPVWVMLQFDEVVVDPEQPGRFHLPSAFTLVVRQGEARYVLQQGQAAPLAGGDLRFDGLTTWMGYNVFYDWTLPWLLAASGMAVASLAWHFHQRFTARPWDA